MLLWMSHKKQTQMNVMYPYTFLLWLKDCILQILKSLCYINIHTFCTPKELAQIWQPTKLKLKHWLLLTKLTMRQSYNPPICQNGRIAQTQKYPRLKYVNSPNAMLARNLGSVHLMRWICGYDFKCNRDVDVRQILQLLYNFSVCS